MLRLAVSRQCESQHIRVELSTLSVSRRLVRVLLRLIQTVDDSVNGPVAVDFGMPPEELARAIGASRGQVAAHLGKLRRAGILSTSRRRIAVLDAHRLLGLDGGEPLA